MCRILCVHAVRPFELAEHLTPFAALSEASREYQGHGWGCSWLTDDGTWRHHHDIRPVWQDSGRPDARTTLLVAHARSAFRDEGIAVENNMPFDDGQRVFVFNGELRGVRIKADGRIGAEKIFNFVKRFDSGDMDAAVRKGVDIIERRTRYVRAMNFIIAGGGAIHVSSLFGEDPDYFQMRIAERADELVVCSEPYGSGRDWQPFPNRTTRSFALHAASA